MTFNGLSDGESTIEISAKKEDEESGLSSATMEEGSAALSKTIQMSEKSDDSSIDGGSEGWTCVIGGCFALFATFGWLNS